LFVLALVVLGLSIWAFVAPCKSNFGDTVSSPSPSPSSCLPDTYPKVGQAIDPLSKKFPLWGIRKDKNFYINHVVVGEGPPSHNPYYDYYPFLEEPAKSPLRPCHDGVDYPCSGGYISDCNVISSNAWKNFQKISSTAGPDDILVPKGTNENCNSITNKCNLRGVQGYFTDHMCTNVYSSINEWEILKPSSSCAPSSSPSLHSS